MRKALTLIVGLVIALGISAPANASILTTTGNHPGMSRMEPSTLHYSNGIYRMTAGGITFTGKSPNALYSAPVRIRVHVNEHWGLVTFGVNHPILIADNETLTKFVIQTDELATFFKFHVNSEQGHCITADNEDSVVGLRDCDQGDVWQKWIPFSRPGDENFEFQSFGDLHENGITTYMSVRNPPGAEIQAEHSASVFINLAKRNWDRTWHVEIVPEGR